MTSPTAATNGATPADGFGMENGFVVETHGLVREFTMGRGVVRAVDEVSIQVEPGQLVAVRGRSGSGKTTLLSLIGALDRPTAGSARVAGMAISEMPERELVA